jgi:hypothetical protein
MKYRLSVAITTFSAPRVRDAMHHAHAGQPPAPHDGAAFFSPPSGFASPAGLSPLFAESFACGLEPLFLKSVAYQPLPFSWKPAAVTIFEKDGLPHFVHTESGASLTFCRNSCWWPQSLQRYS